MTTKLKNMCFIIALTVCLVTAALPAWAADIELKPSAVFATDAPSIVLIKAYNKAGRAIALGSGVVIAKDTVVSNCHVVEKAASARIFYQHKQLATKLLYADVERDLCSFTVKGLSAPTVRIGSTTQVKVGDAAYAIGAPEGLELTLSGGLISSLRKVPGGVVLQMTTPISPGSSGGGLFDSQARLIGITSYYMKEGEQLNFALPVEWINDLPKRGKSTKYNVELLAHNGNTIRGSDLHKAFRAYLAGNYTTALVIFTSLAKQGNATAQSYLGQMYYDGDGVPRDFAKASIWLNKAAQQGNALAQIGLGSMYFNGDGVPKDPTKAFIWFDKAAQQGNAFAQTELGLIYFYGAGVPKDLAKAFMWFEKSAQQGEELAQMELGTMYYAGEGVPQDFGKAATWYRMAAVQGNDESQTSLGTLYLLGQGVPQDYVVAYALFNLAVSHESSGYNKAADNRARLLNLMTPAQVEVGQALTREMERVGLLKALDAYLNGATH